MLTITPWKHKIQFYETDKMGIVHHSNYIRWFEEARMHTLEEIGLGYDVMEASGIISPVLSVEGKFIQMTRFGETVGIQAAVEKFDGLRLNLRYQVIREGDGVLCCTGKSGHCFLNEKGRPISLKRSRPDYYEIFASLPTEFPPVS